MFPDGSIEWADRPTGEVPVPPDAAVMQRVVDALALPDRDRVTALIIDAATRLAGTIPPPMRIDTNDHLTEDKAFYDAYGLLLDRLTDLRRAVA
jgi:hypothetical protein